LSSKISASKASRPGLFCFKGFAEHGNKWYDGKSDTDMDEAEKMVKSAGDGLDCYW